MTTVGPSSDAQILDRGHRPYGGERTGTRGAVRSVVVASIQHALGIHRGARAKIGPVLIVAIAYIPAIAYVGFAVLAADILRSETEFLRSASGALIPTYSALFGSVTFAVAVFTIVIAPEMVCSDRRSRLLGLYLSGPLDRPTYLLAKMIALTLLVSIVTLGPMLLYLTGLTLADFGPDGFVNWARTLGRVLVGGAAAAALLTSVGLAVASFTDRARVASAATGAAIFGSAAVGASLVEGADFDGNWSVLSLTQLATQIVQVIFGEPVEFDASAWVVAAAWAGVLVICTGIVIARYRSVDVTR